MRIFLILIISLLISCAMEPSGDYRLKVVNATNHKFSVEYDLDTLPEYPSVNGTQIYLDHLIEIGDTLNVLEYSLKPWPDFFEKSNNKMLNLFIYNIDSLLKYRNIDTLIKRKIYNRLSYTSQEMNRLNWIVVVADSSVARLRGD